jgi:hypothetical protein
MAFRVTRFIIGLLMMLAFLGQSIFAALPASTMNSLMSAELENPSTNQQDNFEKALSQVLIKVSGNSSIMTLPIIRASLAGVSNMVKSYSMTQNPSNPSKQVFDVSFDPKAISQLLTSAGQPMWDAQRPITLIWLSINNPDGHNTVLDSNAANTQPLAVALKNSAQLRGLSVFFPMLDLPDQSFISSNINNTSPLTTSDMQALADRYHVQSVLAGSLTPSGNQWQTQWRYVLDSAPISWSQDTASTQDTASQVIDTISGTMIAQLAISTTSSLQTQAYLDIHAVNDLQTYSQLSHCLSSLSNMTSLAPMDLSENQVTFQVEFSGTTDLLIQTVTQQCKLTFQTQTNRVTTKNVQGRTIPSTTLPVLNFMDMGGQHV